METYEIRRISCEVAKKYIIKNHYTHGCHNAPFPCYGLFDKQGKAYGLLKDKSRLIGVLMFATPCSEAVRSSIWGPESKDKVIELHRLHILDITPRNTESWFISRCLKLLLRDKPKIRGVISFADETQGHCGTIYKATNFYFIGKTSKSTFYIDSNNRLRHPHQCGVNITSKMAEEKGWRPVKRLSKNRYLKIIANDKRELKKLKSECLYDVEHYNWCLHCGRKIKKSNTICEKCKEKYNENGT